MDKKSGTDKPEDQARKWLTHTAINHPVKVLRMLHVVMMIIINN